MRAGCRGVLWLMLIALVPGIPITSACVAAVDFLCYKDMLVGSMSLDA